MLKVAAGFIRKNDQVLLCRRPETKSRGGKWEFPGGKQEPGETICEALVRELREELAVEVRPIKILTETVFVYPEVTVALTLILVDLSEEQEPSLLEHTALTWVDERTIDRYDLCDADRQLAEQIRPMIKSLLMGERIWTNPVDQS